MTSFHIALVFVYLLSANVFVSRISKKCVVYTTHLHVLSMTAVIFSGFLFRSWSIFALSVAFIPLFAFVFLKIWKRQSIKRFERQNYLVFIEKIILKMQNGNSFRASISELHHESDAFVQQNKSLLTHFVAFSTQKPQSLSGVQESYYQEMMSIDRQPHIALVQLKLLQRSLRLQIFFRRKSGQVSFQARFQSFFIVGIYFVILLLQISYLSFEVVKTYLYLSLPLLALGFVFTQYIGRKLKWNL